MAKQTNKTTTNKSGATKQKRPASAKKEAAAGKKKVIARKEQAGVVKKKTGAKKKLTKSNNKTSPPGKSAGAPKPSGAGSRPAGNRVAAVRKDRQPVREKLAVLRPSGQKEDNFFELVHEVARQIPKGRVTSYGAIAAALGTRLSARMVGWAMNASHHPGRPVPAHRVVNSLGLLTGKHHFNPPGKMQELLEKEGIAVKNDKVVDFKKLFWNPSEEL